ncbi:hypothetical protein BDN67DRAFT_973379 [Paxillus ammoniavirescens]|nr:hypothetical protein BDN67DRAFT_973379 [Paxillus ammoniavirescens]
MGPLYLQSFCSPPRFCDLHRTHLGVAGVSLSIFHPVILGASKRTKERKSLARSSTNPAYGVL